jgi:hypothetical protein
VTTTASARSINGIGTTTISVGSGSATVIRLTTPKCSAIAKATHILTNLIRHKDHRLSPVSYIITMSFIDTRNRQRQPCRGRAWIRLRRGLSGSRREGTIRVLNKRISHMLSPIRVRRGLGKSGACPSLRCLGMLRLAKENGNATGIGRTALGRPRDIRKNTKSGWSLLSLSLRPHKPSVKVARRLQIPLPIQDAAHTPASTTPSLVGALNPLRLQVVWRPRPLLAAYLFLLPSSALDGCRLLLFPRSRVKVYSRRVGEAQRSHLLRLPLPGHRWV